MGIVFTTISKYERGEVKPTTDFLSNICKTYNINLNWLLIGKGEMFIGTNTASIVAEPRSSYNTKKTIKEMTELLDSMPEERQRECIQFCKEKKLLSDLLHERMKKQIKK